MPPGSDPLAALRDIHLPPAPSAWPPAPGWVALAVLVAALLAWLGHLGWRRWRAGRPRRFALRRLADIARREAAGEDRLLLLAELSALLRRTALAHHPRTDVAGLAGDAWTAFLGLDQEPDGARIAAMLTAGPYRRDPPSSLAPVLDFARRWARRAG
ncbi:MAG: DUF4381 family protein [Ectothiorhodospiraceae bacterium]|nr:DUF4381 family protein [Chromatiales bacterium]MCP5155731.1 DUF4381 family protein [Ectothiorhodospiraceae bacterium]